MSSSSEEAGPELPVGVSLCDSAPLLWRVQELRAVRAAGLVGALVGCLPRTPRQNGRLGRPLLLLPEELRVLWGREHTAEELRVLWGREHTAEELRVLRGREHTAEELRVLRGSEHTAEELRVLRGREHTAEEEEEVTKAAQRLRLEEFLSRSHKEQSSLALDDRKSALTSSHSGAEAESLSVRLKALDQNFVLPQSALAVQLSTCRAGLPHLQGSEPIRGHQQDSEPIRSEVRLQVFRDLRRRGFYLTSGGKFGADFLVYPGDPLRFHAHFMAVCVSLDDGVCLRDVLSWARLGSNVKKTLLLCSVLPQGGVVYSSLQWSQMS